MGVQGKGGEKEPSGILLVRAEQGLPGEEVQCAAYLLVDPDLPAAVHLFYPRVAAYDHQSHAQNPLVDL